MVRPKRPRLHKENTWQQDKGKDGVAENKDSAQRNKSFTLEQMKSVEFEKYYKSLNMMPEDEWDDFMFHLRSPLAISFRIAGYKAASEELLQIIKRDFFDKFLSGNIEIDGEKIEAPRCLSWYPNEMAWQVNLDRKTLRKSTDFKEFHKFLVSEMESGFISRQEAVSMIPPLLLDVKSHHKVLDMCAAPGSKTAQLIELLHADCALDKWPSGLIVANDRNNKRCYLMVHQVKRLGSPCVMIVNHDAANFPNLKINPATATPPLKNLMFDRVLCDVPCSGDGTTRKNPDVWMKWNGAIGHSLHGLQCKILRRGAELLEVGGRIVYSTCSFNPVENEAVVATVLQKSEGALELLDASLLLPGLRTVHGLKTWKVIDKGMNWYSRWEELPEHKRTSICESAFPPPEELAEQLNLQRCLRLLPHHQDTGGFFVAVLQKTRHLPWMNCGLSWKKAGRGMKTAEEAEAEREESLKRKEEIRSSHVGDAPLKVFHERKRRRQGFKEDPFIFLEKDEPYWPQIRDFYGVSDEFPVEQLLVRCKEGKKRIMYFTTEIVKNILEYNAERDIKFINMGIKMLERNEAQQVECDYRLVQEGISVSYSFLKKRHIEILQEDIIRMLETDCPLVETMSELFQQQIGNVSQGSLIYTCHAGEGKDKPNVDIRLIGWRAAVSVRTFLPRYEKFHFLRLCGAAKKHPEDLPSEDVVDKLESSHAGEDDLSNDEGSCDAQVENKMTGD